MWIPSLLARNMQAQEKKPGFKSHTQRKILTKYKENRKFSLIRIISIMGFLQVGWLLRTIDGHSP